MSNNKLVLTFLAVVFGWAVIACGSPMAKEPQGLVDGGMSTPQATNQLTLTTTATASIEPSATVDYAATVAAVQATLDETMRLNVEATAQYEARVHEQYVMTQQVEGITATLALTSVPLTATQQAALNTQIAAQQTSEAVHVTQTAEAPQLMIDMQNAQEYVQFAPARVGGDLFLKFALGVVLFFFASTLRQLPHWSKKAADKMLEEYVNSNGQNQVGVRGEAVVHQVDVTKVELKDSSNGYSKTLQFVVPCSPDALTELAQALVSGTKTFAINSWEGSESKHFTRKLIEEVRHFFMLNRFAISMGGGQVVLTELGKKFLLAWLDGMRLPDEYQFENVKGE